MIFNDDEVNLPEPLLQSLTRNELTVFVGAGASARAFAEQPEGTFYPSFKGLAEELGKRLGRDIAERENKYIEEGFIDRLLGEWEDRRGNVRRYAAEILATNEDDQRIDLHRTILRLFAADSIPRVVTTNFDRLLFRAREAEGLDASHGWRSYIAPALPPGRRFSGICCLHGTVDDPTEMILTDKDIGRAYMHEGWALRFAHDMFQNFDVLFVGYSLEDPPLRYLSLALEGTNAHRRWALLPKPADHTEESEKGNSWSRRNVEAIWYPFKDSDHRALERTLATWGKDNARSFLERRSVLADLGRADPTHLRPHEISRTHYFLQDPPLLRDFMKNPLDVEWFDRLLEWGHFDFLFKGDGTANEAHGLLVDRLIDWIIADPVALLAKLTWFRPTIHPDLFDRLCYRIKEEEPATLDTPTLVRIVEFFRPALEHSRSSHLSFTKLEIILGRLLDGGYEDYGIWLFTRLLQTQSIVTRRSNLFREYERRKGKDVSHVPEFELHFELRFTDQVSDHVSKEIFDKVFRPRIKSVGVKLVYALTQTLMELRAFEQPGVSLRSHHTRAAIEPHDQDQYRITPVDSVLNLVRDSWEALLSVDKPSAEAAYSAWGPISDDLIERLRIHALRKLLEANGG
ncbi:MAG: SIR2 family protein [Thermodesulfobacteriota bacterium]